MVPRFCQKTYIILLGIIFSGIISQIKQTGGIDVTDRDFLKSLVLFLIYDVPENTRESSLQLYQRWQKKTGIIVRHPDRAVWTLEYLERMKHYRRGALKEAAVIDGFISRGQLSARQKDED